jgi:predicted nucleic acid-binding protein
LSGLAEKTVVVHTGLEVLIARESTMRPAVPGGSEPTLKPIARRRSHPCHQRRIAGAVLVDTSVWVDHFRRRKSRLVQGLDSAQALTHPFVTGQLARGYLARRDEILSLLQSLPALPLIGHNEVLKFVDAHRLLERVLGWVGMHLPAAARLARVSLWTLDQRLAAAVDLGVAAGAA